jgi:hypothetical protein
MSLLNNILWFIDSYTSCRVWFPCSSDDNEKIIAINSNFIMLFHVIVHKSTIRSVTSTGIQANMSTADNMSIFSFYCICDVV